MFVVDVAQFRSDFEANGPGVPGLPPQEANERLRKFQRLFEERERKWEAYVAGEQLFGLAVTQYPELERTKAELQLLDKLYNLYTNVLNTVVEFNEMQWTDVCGFNDKNESHISVMVKKLEEFQLACKKMPKELRAWDAYVELKKTVDDFLESLPLVEQLANPSLRPRHWKALEELTGKTLNVGSDSFKLKDLLDAGILEISDDVEEIAASAVKELAIEGKLNDIANDWVVRSLTFGAFKQRGNIVLNMGATAEMMEVLEESQMGLGSMLASRFVLPFKEMADEWVEKLSAISEILEQWTAVQAMWQYLEAVFTSGDIAKQLPQESKRFQGIDKNWVKIMSKGNEVPNVVNYIVGNDVLKQLCRRCSSSSSSARRRSPATSTRSVRRSLASSSSRMRPCLRCSPRAATRRPSSRTSSRSSTRSCTPSLARRRRPTSRCSSRPRASCCRSSTCQGRGQHRGVARPPAQGDAGDGQPHHLVRCVRLRHYGH